MKNCRYIALLPTFLLASCAADATKKESAAPAYKSLSERLSESSGYKPDAEGHLKPQSNKRSSLETQGAATGFKKDYHKKEYKTGDYAKKSWWGSKDYERKSYAGSTDGSRFRKSSGMQDQAARETGSAAEIPAPYQTNSYATRGAREANTPEIARTGNAAIENRKKVFKQPDIIDWKEQRSLSLYQSKTFLGR